MVPSDIAAKRVVFGGPRFICRNVIEGAPRSIMHKVDIASVAELIQLSPCTCAGNSKVTSSDYAVVDSAWGSRGWTDWCDGDLVLSGRHCCYLLDELLEDDVGC